jgi:hypothetical protein
MVAGPTHRTAVPPGSGPSLRVKGGGTGTPVREPIPHHQHAANAPIHETPAHVRAGPRRELTPDGPHRGPDGSPRGTLLTLVS